MTAATASNVDYVAMARVALARAEQLSDEIEAAPAKVPQCREAWKNYGEALRAQRTLTPGNTAFGQWVHAHGLDTGRAAHASFRSDCMWLAENWAHLTRGVTLTNHAPDHIRQECRAAGYEWARATQRTRAQAEARATRPARAPRAPRPPAPDATMGWVEAVHPLLNEVGRAYLGFRVHAAKRREIEIEYGQPFAHRLADADMIRALAAAVQRCADRHAPAPEPAPEPDRATIAARTAAESAAIQAEVSTLSETARQRFDRLVQRKIDQLTADFRRQVDDEVRARVEPERARLLAAIEAANVERMALHENRQTLEYWMTQEEFRLVLGCLHPDRAPADQQSRFGRAFDIVKRLEGHLGTDRRYLQRQGWSR